MRPSRDHRRPWSALTALVVLASALAPFAGSPGARAEGAPNITLSKGAPGEVLFGADSRVTLTAANPAGETAVGYNLSFRDVLPPGVSLVAGSATVAPTRILADRPNPGETTLIWENLADITPSSSFAVGYDVRHSTADLDVGDVYVNAAGAYVNSDPRFVPDFDPISGVPLPGANSYTGFATAAATTAITAVEITKSEPNAEGEILRGIHDHQTVYTLTVRNNYVNPTSGIVVEDYLGAGLEYLGCGAVDNTTNAPTNPGGSEEYPGSGPINPGNAPVAPDCLLPDLVETLAVDPDGAGPLPAGVYTHVVWSGLGTMAPGETRSIQYLAAVPILENSTSWPLGEPAPGSLLQAANLDNNSGPETFDEQDLANLARVAGLYDGILPVADTGTLHRSAEDLSVHKTVSDGAINQNDVEVWSLLIETSEYRFVDDVRVADTIPDGLCPLDSSNLESPDFTADCAPSGDLPSSPYTSAVENADGTWSVAWDSSTEPALSRIQPSSSFTITFPTRTRPFYQEGFAPATPVLARDSWTNSASVAGADSARCAPADPDCSGDGTRIYADEADGTTDSDESSAGQSASGPVIDKRVAIPGAVPLDCTTATYIDTVASAFGPGDRVCWQLRAEFPARLDTGGVTVTDFIPPAGAYEAGSMAPTLNSSVPIAAFDDSVPGVLSWTLGSGGYTDAALVFEVQFATTFGDPGAATSADIVANLMKLNHTNTPGQAFPLRDQADVEWAEAELDLLKGVALLDRDGNPGTTGDQTAYAPPSDGVTVAGGNLVQYRLDLVNAGTRAAGNVEVWDRLPAMVACSMVSDVSAGGTCNNGGTPGDPTDDRIEWTGLSVSGGGTLSITYWVAIPVAVAPGEILTNTAGVREYTSPTNLGGDFTYIPEGNIDPTQEPGANTDPADDPSNVVAAGATLVKARSTAVTEGGNLGPSEATIGERVNYTVTLTIPFGTTVYGPAGLSDALGSRQTYVAASLAASLNGGDPAAAGLVLSDAGNTISAVFPAAYTPAGPAADVLVVSFAATVDDEAANRRGGSTLGNTAVFTWQTSAGVTASRSSSVTTRIVEPNLGLTKGEDDPDDVVAPGQILRYTLRVTNADAPPPDVSTAHDLTVIDLIPTGLTPVDGAGTPILDGGPVPPNGGIWDEGARTITWPLAVLASNGVATFEYDAAVDDPAVSASAYTNQAVVTGSSLSGSQSGERTTGTGYSATAQDTVTVQRLGNSKSVVPSAGTVGDDLTFTLIVVVPPDIAVFDGTVADLLPDGIDFDGFVSASCSAGCPPDISLVPLPPVFGVDGSTTLGWFFGDVAPAPAARELTLVFAAHIDDRFEPEGTPVGTGTLVNRVTTYWNRSDRISGTPGTLPDLSAFESTADPASATVAVVEPQLTLDKDVSGDADDDDVRPAQAGDGFSYSVVVANTGGSPAYDVVVVDRPDAELTNVVPTTGAGFLVDGWTLADPDMIWVLPGPIEPGPAGSVTLGYTADLVASAGLSAGQQVVNTADVPSYFAVPGAERTANGFDYREYDDVAADTVRLDVAFPQLSISKTTGLPGFPDAGSAELLQPLPWRIVVTNNSTAATALGVDVRDTLPPNWAYDPGSAVIAPGGAAEPAVTSSPGGDLLEWIGAGDLAPGASLTITFTATPALGAALDPGSGPLNPHLNTANAAGDDADGAPGNADGPYATGDDDATAILGVPLLVLAKGPDGDPAVAGAPAQYQVVVENLGAGAARSVVVRDLLPEGVAYTPGTAAAVPAAGFTEVSVTPGPGAGETTIEWGIAQIDPGGSVTIVVPVDVEAPQPDGTELVNTASVTSAELPAPVGDQGTLVVASSPVWAEASRKASVPASGTAIAPGDRIDYGIRYENTGNEDATGVVVTDAIAENASYVAGSVTSAPSVVVQFLVGGSYQNEEPADGGMVEGLRWLIGDVPIGGFGDVGFAVIVAAPLPNGTIIVNSADLVSDQTPGGLILGPVSHPVTSAPALDLVKSVSDTDLHINSEGALLVYSLHLSNTGDEAATGVRVTDEVPPGTTLTAIEDGGLTVQCSTDGVSFGECPADLAAVIALEWSTPSLGISGPVVFGFSVTVDLPAQDGAVLPNAAAIDTDQTGRGESNEVETVIRAQPEIDLIKLVTPVGVVVPGDTVRYTLTWENAGSADAADVVVDDSIPEGTTYVAGSATGVPAFLVGGSYQPVEPADPSEVLGLRWTQATLAVGETRTVFFEVQLDGVLAVGAVIENTAAASAAGLEPVDASVSSPVDAAPELAITKTALQSTVAPGDEITYLIEVTVSGNAPADPLIVGDQIPPGTGFVSATNGGTFAGGVVTWDLGAQLPGSTIQLFMTVRLTGDFADGEVLINRAGVSAPGAVDAFDTAGTVVEASAILQVTKIAADATLDAGQQALYAITVRNSGDGIALGVVLEDALPAGLQFVSSSPAPATTGPLRWNLGDLAPGQSVTVALVARPQEAGPVVNTASARAANASPDEGSAAVDVAELPVTGLEHRWLGLAGVAGLVMLGLGALLLGMTGRRRQMGCPPGRA